MAKPKIEDQIASAVTELINAAGLPEPSIRLESYGNGHFYNMKFTVSFVKPYGHSIVDLSQESSSSLLDQLSNLAYNAEKDDNQYSLMRQIKHELMKRIN